MLNSTPGVFYACSFGHNLPMQRVKHVNYPLLFLLDYFYKSKHSENREIQEFIPFIIEFHYDGNKNKKSDSLSYHHWNKLRRMEILRH